MRVNLTKIFTIHAGHSLPWHSGKCKNRHGHTYKLHVTVSGTLNENGVVIDFSDIKAIVNSFIVEKLDHQDLDKIYPNPTAELMAIDIFQKLNVAFVKTRLEQIDLYETETCKATVKREEFEC